MKLEISLNNCFGIGKFNSSYDLSNDNTIMIYAPNGTMKTSLARTILCLENNHNAADFIDETKESSYSFMLDGKKLESTQVYVYKTEDNQIEPNGIFNLEEDNVKSFVSSPRYETLFNSILRPIDSILEDINKRFNEFSCGKIDFHEEVLKLYKHEGILAKYDSIYNAIMESKSFDSSKCNFSGVCYNELFDKYGVSAKYIKSHYNELINKTPNRKSVKVGGQRRWKRLCDIVDCNSYIRSKIGDLESLRREYLLYFIKSENVLASEFNSLYEQKRAGLLDIIRIINENTQLWNKVVKDFNSRFRVPYHLQIENKAEALLNQDFLRIKYLKTKGEGNIEYKNKEHFLNFISNGEKRAYYLLLNLFEIEKRKKSKERQIIVFDDIVESFDYKNKYAVVEYLAELKQCKNFILIILTHNFDFYRTVHSRLSVRNAFIASKGNNGVITLENGKYVKDIIKNELIKNAHKTKYMIALIPFVRNIVEYTKGANSSEYKSLTSYLHMLNGTKSLTLCDLYKIICSNIFVEQKKVNDVCGNYYDELNKVVSEILKSGDDISIANKLILSISIRLRGEEFARKLLPGQFINRIENEDRYTFLLFNEYKRANSQDTKGCSILTKVLMMTSENIHLNNFMFEPIIDLSLEHLKVLCEEVTKLNESI